MGDSAPVTPVFVTGGGVTLPVHTPDSGKFVLDYKWRWTDKQRGDYATIAAQVNAGFYTRGTLNGGWIITQARVDSEKGTVATLEIDYESIAGQLPPDEPDLQRENLQPHIERHPIFQALTPTELSIVQQAHAAYTATGQATAKNQFTGDNAALMLKLFEKLKRGFESYYLAGSRYVWNQYYLPGEVPSLSNGGYTQEPGGPYGGGLLPGNVQWLREADSLSQGQYSPLGGIQKVTRSWVGGPDGWWDPDIYPPG